MGCGQSSASEQSPVIEQSEVQPFREEPSPTSPSADSASNASHVDECAPSASTTSPSGPKPSPASLRKSVTTPEVSLRGSPEPRPSPEIIGGPEQKHPHSEPPGLSSQRNTETASLLDPTAAQNHHRTQSCSPAPAVVAETAPQPMRKSSSERAALTMAMLDFDDFDGFIQSDTSRKSSGFNVIASPDKRVKYSELERKSALPRAGSPVVTSDEDEDEEIIDRNAMKDRSKALVSHKKQAEHEEAQLDDILQELDELDLEDL